MNFLLKTVSKLFLVSVILVACKNQSKIGLEVAPQGQNIGTYMEDSLNVQLTTILLDSVVTSSPYNVWVGDMNDPNVGKLSVKTFTQVTLTKAGFAKPIDAIFDSLTFTFKYGDIKFGDTTLPFKLNVYKVTQNIADSTYYNSSTRSYNPTPIGSTTFQPSKFNKKHIDSVSIKLDDAIGQDLLDKIGSTEFSTESNFTSYFNGLLLGTDGSNSSIIGGSLTPDSASSKRLSRMVLSYHLAADPGKAIKLDFPIYSTSKKFAQYTSDRAGTNISNIIHPKDSTTSLVSATAYLQEGTGLAVKIAFPTIQKLKERYGAVIINRAELIIPSLGVTNKTTNQAPSLFMFQASANGKYLRSTTGTTLPVQKDGTSNPINTVSNTNLISYDYTNNQYSILLTDYIQGILFNTATPYYLLRTNTTGASNFVIGNKFHPTGPIKLKIHFSKVN